MTTGSEWLGEVPRRSISQLKSFTKCGEAFYHNYVNRPDTPERPAVWTIMGLAVHDAIEGYDDSNHLEPIEELYDRQWQYYVDASTELQPDWREWIIPPPGKSVKNALINYKERGFNQVRQYAETWSDPEWPWEVIDSEIKFQLELDKHLVVRGAVDRVVRNRETGQLVVEDLKSGNLGNYSEDYRQLAFYCFALREGHRFPLEDDSSGWRDQDSYGDAQYPVTYGRLWLTKLNRATMMADLSQWGHEYWESTFKKLTGAIRLDLFLANPSEKNCGLCEYKPICSAHRLGKSE